MKQRIPLDNGITLVIDRSATGEVLLDIEHPVFSAFLYPIRLKPEAAAMVALCLGREASAVVEKLKQCRCLPGTCSGESDSVHGVYCREMCAGLKQDTSRVEPGTCGDGEKGQGGGAVLPVCDSGCEMRCDATGVRQPGRACWLEGA